MSRTYRRKGKEPSWLVDDEDWLWRLWHRTPKQQIAFYHSDCWDGRFTARKWGKRYWAKLRRQWDRQEFAKFHKYAEYEPIFFTTKTDTWFWD